MPGPATPPPLDLTAPLFHTSPDSLPRPGALLYGAVAAAACLAGFCLLLARGGEPRNSPAGPFPLSRPAAVSPMTSAAPFEFSRQDLARGETFGEDLPVYFRLLAILSALDLNRDGVLSAGEIAAAPASLARLDANRDGRLDPAECGGDFDGPSTAGLDPAFLARARLAFMRMHPALAALDADHDGIISAAEIRDSPALLRTLDADDDGRLTVGELLPDPLTVAVAQFIGIFDRNGDGELSSAEWAAGFGPLLRAVLVRAAPAPGVAVSSQALVSQLRFDPRTGSQDSGALREMRAASRQGFAEILARGVTAPHSTVAQ